MGYARIMGTGSALPQRVVTNKDLMSVMDTSEEWIRTRTGICQRHIVGDKENTVSLGAAAAQAALDMANLSVDQVDLIICATSTPQYIFPSTACLIQKALGNRMATAFDVQAVCAGFVYGLTIAEKFITSGSHRRALVIGSEVFSRILDWKDRGTCVLFGDGAGAVLLEASNQPGIDASVLRADGHYSDILCVPGNIQGGQVYGDPFLRMQGTTVFKFAVKVLEEATQEVLVKINADVASIDWWIPHQANVRIIESVAHKLGLDMSRIVVTVDVHGNTSAASIPMALDCAVRDGRIRAGQRVVLAGVGGGFSWGAVTFTF